MPGTQIWPRGALAPRPPENNFCLSYLRKKAKLANSPSPPLPPWGDSAHPPSPLEGVASTHLKHVSNRIFGLRFPRSSFFFSFFSTFLHFTGIYHETNLQKKLRAPAAAPAGGKTTPQLSSEYWNTKHSSERDFGHKVGSHCFLVLIFGSLQI